MGERGSGRKTGNEVSRCRSIEVKPSIPSLPRRSYAPSPSFRKLRRSRNCPESSIQKRPKLYRPSTGQGGQGRRNTSLKEDQKRFLTGSTGFTGLEMSGSRAGKGSARFGSTKSPDAEGGRRVRLSGLTTGRRSMGVHLALGTWNTS